MGKNGGNPSKSWFTAVKKVFRSPNSKDTSSDKRYCPSEDLEQQEQEKRRGKRRWIFRKPLNYKEHNSVAKPGYNVCEDDGARNTASLEAQVAEEEKKHAIAVAIATTAAAEAAVATAQAAVEFIRVTRPCKQNQAATTIQKAFRGYLARRALRALKGVVLLQALIRGHNVRKRTELTLLRMQTLIRVQTQVCYQRRRHSVSDDRSFCSSSFTDGTPISTHENQEENLSITKEIDSISMPRVKKEAAWKCERDQKLAHAFSHKIWSSQREEYSDSEGRSGKHEWADKCRGRKQWERPGRYSCDQRIPIKIVHVEDTDYYPSSYFLKLKEENSYNHNTKFNPCSNSSLLHNARQIPSFQTPIKAYQPELQHLRIRSASPHFLRYEESIYPKSQTPSFGCYQRSNGTVPNYMAETESTRSRVRSQSVPRQQMPPHTPERDGTGLTKRRLFFAAPSEAASASFTNTPRVQR